MNDKNIKTWEDGGKAFAEWSDRALDDGDRYNKDSIMLTVSVPLGDNQEKRLMTAMVATYDEWMRGRGG